MPRSLNTSICPTVGGTCELLVSVMVTGEVNASLNCQEAVGAWKNQ
jgi:hypothetical protein